MKALIIEDEIPAQRILERLLVQYCPHVSVVGRTGSITGAVGWLRDNQADVIFMDVELSDGLCFEIFRLTDVKSKVIITTAYDSYAIRAFKVNSIDYILKPVDSAELVAAVAKCREHTSDYHGLDAALLEKLFNRSENYKERFTVKMGDRIIVVDTRNIAYIHSEDKSTYIATLDDKNYIVDFTLDSIEDQMNPKRFCRVSRNCIASIDSIKSINRYFNGRLKLTFKPPLGDAVVVSRQRSQIVLDWLEGN